MISSDRIESTKGATHASKVGGELGDTRIEAAKRSMIWYGKTRIKG